MAEYKTALESILYATANGRYLIPNSALTKLVSQDNLVKQAIQSVKVAPEDLNDLLKRAVSDCRIIFAILTRIEEVRLFSDFVSHGFTDFKLPCPPIGLSHSKSKQWDQIQWEFLSPTFSQGLITSHFEEKVVLPYKTDRLIAQGGSGKIYEVEILASHQTLCLAEERETIKFVRKEIHDSNIEDFIHEVQILKKLGFLKNPSISHLLFSYTHQNKYNLIFPRAEKDLSQFLKEDSLGHDSFKTNSDYLKAIHGLVCALDDLHHYGSSELALDMNGCHHDIKPQNILVNHDKFILADFGIARLTAQNSNTKTIFKRGCDDYYAPESYVLDWNEQAIGRKADIWSLGCILLELATYILLGAEGLEDFKGKRRTATKNLVDCRFHDGIELKSQVGRWIYRLQDRTQDEAILVWLHFLPQLLSKHPNDRPTTSIIKRHSFKIYTTSLASRIMSRLDEFNRQHRNTYFHVEKERFRSWLIAYKEADNEVIGEYIVVGLPGILLKFQVAISEDNIYSHEDKHIIESVVASLRHQNDRLEECSPRAIRDETRRSWHRKLIRDDTSLEELQVVARAQFNNEVWSLATFKMRMISFLKGQAPSQDIGPPRNQLLSTDVSPDKQRFGQHQLGWLLSANGHQRKRVILETRLYKSMSQELLFQTQALAELPNIQWRPVNFRVLDCAGFLDTGSSLELVYLAPKNVVNVDPFSLSDLINSTRDDILSRPHLGHIFTLAQRFVECVLEFHSVGWYHKNLIPSNIVFFPESNTLKHRREAIVSPFIIGFNHSRQRDQSVVSVGPVGGSEVDFQHPRYRDSDSSKREYRKLYEYYSVGIILLQIGLWRPIQNMRPRDIKCSADEFAKILLEKYVPRLEHCMGHIYCTAVRACLSGKLGDESTDEAKIEDNYLKWVVNPLSLCRA